MPPLNFLGLTRDFQNYATPCNGHIVVKNGDAFSYGSKFCQHMGMEILNEEVKEECMLSCPYHGLPLQTQPCWHGGEFLFSENLPVRAFSPLLTISEDLGPEFQVEHNTDEFPWYLWMQNTMDPHHIWQVHKHSFGKLFEKQEPFSPYCEKNFSSYYMAVCPSHVEAWERMMEERLSNLFFHLTVYPGLSVTSFLGLVYSVETVTTDGHWTRIKTRYFESKSKPMLHEPMRDLYRRAHNTILKEDMLLCAKLGRNHQPPNFYLPGEERIKHFLRWASENEQSQ